MMTISENEGSPTSPRRDAGEGTMLWVASSSGDDARALAQHARDFGLELRMCTLLDAAEAVRAPAELIAFELDGDRERSLAQLRRIHERMPAVPLIAVSADTGVPAIREALAAGASEVLSLPFDRAEVAKAFIKLAELRRRDTATLREPGKIVTVYGARGGLGSTTLAVNLAVRLQMQGQRDVALVDLDLQRGDVSAFLNLTPIQSVAALAAAEKEIDAAFIRNTLSLHGSGVYVLPAPLLIEEADTIGHEEASLALTLLRQQFAFTVVDTSRTLMGATVAALEHSDRILVITDLSVPGVRAAQRTVDVLRQLGPVRPELIVADRPGSDVPLKDAVRTIGVDAVMTIPRDDATACDAMNAGTPLNGKQSSLTLAIGQLAGKLLGTDGGAGRRRRFLGRIFN
jgi:pilus assembly protein CpaE